MENIKFLNMDHEINYKEYLKRSSICEDDFERKSLFYLLSLNKDIRNHIDSLYDFKDNNIKFSGLNQGWQTGGSIAITKLAFNLYNNFDGEYFNENEELEKTDLTPLNIFASVDRNLIQFLFFAINLRIGL